jgi:hypothetical protein
MQRAAKIADLEEADEHEAAQDKRLQKKAAGVVGRPKKGRSQLLADVSKMIRDRVRMIAESHTKAVAIQKALADEGLKELGTLPADLVAIKEEMNKETKAAAEKIDLVVKEMNALSPATLITNCNEAAEEIKKALVEKTTDVFKKHIPEINKSIAAFKGAMRKAIAEKNKQSKKKGKSAPGQQETPLLTRTLKELVAKNTDAFAHVEVIADPVQLEQIEKISSAVRLVTLPEPFKKMIAESTGVEGHLKWMRKQLQKELREMQ